MLQECKGFFISKEHIDSVIDALAEYFTAERVSLVDRAVKERMDELSGILLEADLGPEYDEDGNIVGIVLLGEKIHDADKVFDVLASFVGDGASIEVADEWGRKRCWTFIGGSCAEI